MVNKLTSLSVTQLESLISRYPWFALARKELYLRTSMMGEEYRRVGMKRAGVYVPCREKLVWEGLSPQKREYATTPDEAAAESRDRQTIRVIGGDWFSQEDLNSISEKNYDFTEKDNVPDDPSDSIVNISNELFYTETLARIYGEQELHQMAIDIYEKLILIYPEKSTYFAALIEEQKKHLKD